VLWSNASREEDGIVADDEEEKLPTDEELPTSADDEEIDKGEEQEDIVVEVPGGIIYYGRDSDGKLDSGREFSTEELIPDEGSYEDLRIDKRRKTIDLDTILAVQEVQEADNKPLIQGPDSSSAEIREPRPCSTSADLELHFSQSDLDSFVAHRKAGLAAKSLD
jgi:hypothetical protein